MVIMNTQNKHKKSEHKKSEKEGFVILVAVLVATVVVALGAFIAAIAVKELELSSSGRESQDAFYAADAALECALLHDFRVQQFGSDIANPIVPQCNGIAALQYTIGNNGDGTPSDASNSVTYFAFEFRHPLVDTPLRPFALVKVTKKYVGTVNDKTVIEAQGYNVRDASLPGRVQRALQVVY